MNYAVVIPAFNSARTIVETLDSVFAQTVPPSEVVVVDDESSDTTVQIVKSYGQSIQLIEQQNMGCGGATTTGITATNMPLVATVDGDDLWMPQKMERQLARMAQLDARSLLFSKSRQFRHEDADRSNGLERDGLVRSSMLMHRSALDEIGPIIDPPIGCGDMVDWLGRARGLGFKIEVIPEVLMLRRIIQGSMTNGGVQDQNRGYLSVARAAILRRRQAELK